MPRGVAAGSAMLAMTLAGLAGGCALPWSGPDPAPAARAAAAQLSAGKPSTAFDSGAARLWAETAGDLPGTPKVTVTKVSEQDGRATATLAWDWPLAGQHWTYSSKLALTRTGEKWRAQLDPEAIAPGLGKGAVLRATTLKAERGRILDGTGRPIVEPRPVLRVGIDKTQLGTADPGSSAKSLARLAGIDQAAYVKAVTGAGPKAFVQAIVYRRDEAPGWVGAGAVPGLRAISDHLALAPTKNFAPGLLGTVGPATAELIEKSKGRIKAGDDTGVSGLQLRYDAELSGTNGIKVVRLADPSQENSERTTLFSAPAKPGTDLKLSLDIDQQRRALAALSGIGPNSALVAIRPSSGAIVAAASGPGSGGLNTATFGKAAPGSTFKIVSSLGLLRSGLNPESPVSCPPTTTVDGKRFKNYSDYPAGSLGRITLAQAVAQSCNTAFIGNHDKLSPQVIAGAAAALGFGVDHDVGFPAYFGSIPTPASDTEAAADVIGQGRVQASPMAMATVLASVVAGKAVVPTLIQGRAVTRQPPATPLTPAETKALRSMLRGVVQHGSGSGLQGVADLAKTGTAEFGTGGRTHAWMVAARGDLAAAVYVEVGTSGSHTAGPVLRQFLAG